jgi:hypothetical protein
MRLRQRAAMGGEVARNQLQRVLILRVRRDHLFDQPAPVELLAMRQHVVPQGLIMSQACELTIETALSDPIVMDVMAADCVDPREL